MAAPSLKTETNNSLLYLYSKADIKEFDIVVPMYARMDIVFSYLYYDSLFCLYSIEHFITV